MADDLTKKAVDMLLKGATLLSEPCPYCSGVRVMKDGRALCVNCGKEPTKKQLESKSKTPIEIMEKKLEMLSKELEIETNHEMQQKIIQSINSLIEAIDKMKK